MIAYVDSSVLLRILLLQRDPLREWTTIQRGVSSALIRVETQRTLDRLRLNGDISADEYAGKRAEARQMLANLAILPLDESTLEAAAAPMNHSLRSLDAIHLATALRFRAAGAVPLVFATHDHALATAARATGFTVLGA